MNIFEDFDRLAVGPSAEMVKHSMDFTMACANKIKMELGEDSNLLSDYLTEIFKMISFFDLHYAVKEGTQVYNMIFNDCCKFCGVDSGKEKSKYYELVEFYINEHPLAIDSGRKKANIYTIKIFVDYLDLFSRDFITELKNKFLEISNKHIQNNAYEKIEKIVGETNIKYFNGLLEEFFFMNPIGCTFVQQIIFHCTEALKYRESTSDKSVFEILMEENT